MIKNSAINLCILLFLMFSGMLLANGLVFAILYLKGISIEDLFHKGTEIVEKLNSKELLSVQLMSHVFGLILPAFIFTKWRLKSNEGLISSPFDVKLFIICLLFFVFCIPVVSASAWLNQIIPLPEWAHSSELQIQAMLQKLLHFENGFDLISIFITIAIIPGIAEEWIFRGILQNQLSGLFENKYVAWICASIIFSAVHFQFEGFLPRFCLGMMLGFVFMQTRSLWYSILIHIGFNGSQVLGVYFMGTDLIKEGEKIEFNTVNWISLVVCIPFIFLSVKKLIIQNKIVHA